MLSAIVGAAILPLMAARAKHADLMADPITHDLLLPSSPPAARSRRSR